MGQEGSQAAVSAKPLESASLDGLYEQDFVVWCEQTARLLRASQFAEIDIENLIEEVEAMAGSQRREVDSRLRVLMLHLLKWDKKPEKRSRSWLSTMDTQRTELEGVLEQSPSLRRTLPEAITKMYPAAVRGVSLETGLPRGAFSSECPYTLEQILDYDFPPHQDVKV